MRYIAIPLVAFFLLLAYLSLEELIEEREEFDLTASLPLENAPPELVLATTALGGFRGIIVDYLWIRAMGLKESGKYFELVQLYDWIGKMEPRIEAVWAHNAWNMAYNISVELNTPGERWSWIKRGIELLRDEGLRYNPRSSLLYKELAWIYQHKIGGVSDAFHWEYKRCLAEEMEGVLGKDSSLLSGIASSKKTKDNLLRYNKLTQEMKLDPQRMLEMVDTYGPLDWTLAQSHALYWLTKGLDLARKKAGLSQSRAERGIDRNYERLILHAIISLCEAGRVFRTDTGFIITGPDFRFIDTAEGIYGQLKEKYKEDVGLASAHENFLQSMVVLLYTYGREKDSLSTYRRLRALNPSRYRMGCEDYIFVQIKEDLEGASPLEVSAFIQGILRQSLMSLAIGDDERSAGLENLAKLVWNRYMKEYGKTERASLPPLEEIRTSLVKRALGGEFPPVLQNRLRERLGLSEE